MKSLFPRFFAVVSFVSFLFQFSAFAGPRHGIPDCLDNQSRVLSIMNDQVLKWKQSSPNQYQARALVQGVVEKVYTQNPRVTDPSLMSWSTQTEILKSNKGAGNNAHMHFSIRIGNQPGETLEVVYNVEFGDMPAPNVGDQVIACGDYITSNAPTDRYQPSPDGAIIHWVHRSPDLQRHQHGYVVINQRLYGF